MDAKGVDRPVALVAGEPSPLLAATLARLLDRGFEVHLPSGLIRLTAPVPSAGRRLRVTDEVGGPGAGRAALHAALATRRPPAVAVLTADVRRREVVPHVPEVLALVCAAMEAWGSGHVLLVAGAEPHPTRSTRLPRSTLTVPVGSTAPRMSLLSASRVPGVRAAREQPLSWPDDTWDRDRDAGRSTQGARGPGSPLRLVSG